MEVWSHVSLTKYWLMGLWRFAKYDVESGLEAVDVDKAVPAIREKSVPVLLISSDLYVERRTGLTVKTKRKGRQRPIPHISNS